MKWRKRRPIDFIEPSKKSPSKKSPSKKSLFFVDT
jgi:hypothetical protein